MQLTTLDIRSPDVNNLQDVEMIQSALSSSPGIGEVDVDVDQHAIIVKTANQDCGADVIRRLDDAGFKMWQVSVM